MEEGLGGKSESEVYDGYKGRGLMQITYKSNYEGYGKAINENFLGANKVRIAKEKKTCGRFGGVVLASFLNQVA